VVNGTQIGNVALGFGRIYETMQIVPVPTQTPMPPKDSGGISFGEQVAKFAQLHAAAKLGAADQAASISVEVTGHSLGSALTTYYVLENATTQKIKNPAICTFASPKVGDSGFTGAFNKLNLTSWRVANVRDVVPKMPPWFLFTHVNTEQLIDSTGKASPGLICCHKLTTYLHVLDPQYPVDQDCQVVPAHLASGETKEMSAKQIQARVWPDI
jgi:Lipase (class 3)